MISEAPSRLVTAEELLKLDAQGFCGELIRGVLCEMPPPGIEHGQICLRIGAKILQFVDEQQLGSVTSNDAGVVIERSPDTVRGPDVAYFSHERLPPDARVPGYAEVAPDLAVEVKSPSDSRDSIHDKALMWLRYGVREVWVVLPETRQIDVYRAGEGAITLTESDALEGGNLLPSFRCRVSENFPASQDAP